MDVSVLVTRLQPPPVRSGRVARPRLIELLDGGLRLARPYPADDARHIPRVVYWLLTTLIGVMRDQASLRELLCKVWDLNLAVLSVNRVDEEVARVSIDTTSNDGERTTEEDRMLREELAGYEAYTRQVRYRLLPGIW